MLSRFLQPGLRDFDSLDEREILSLAVAAEEEDGGKDALRASYAFPDHGIP